MPAHLPAFIFTSMFIIVAPGPSVLFTIARAIAWGRATAVLTVVGNAIGMVVLATLVAIGLGPILQRSTVLLDVVVVAGGLYLIWLGIDAIRHRRAHAVEIAGVSGDAPSTWATLRQGFVVGFLNPKALVFFASVFPQFLNHAEPAAPQLFFMGVLFSLLALVSDGTWGLLAGTARSWLGANPARIITMRLVGGAVMCVLGTAVLLNTVVH